jgi:hypothetical protein
MKLTIDQDVRYRTAKNENLIESCLQFYEIVEKINQTVKVGEISSVK